MILGDVRRSDEYPMPDTRCQIPDARCQMPRTVWRFLVCIVHLYIRKQVFHIWMLQKGTEVSEEICTPPLSFISSTQLGVCNLVYGDSTFYRDFLSLFEMYESMMGLVCFWSTLYQMQVLIFGILCSFDFQVRSTLNLKVVVSFLPFIRSELFYKMIQPVYVAFIDRHSINFIGLRIGLSNIPSNRAPCTQITNIYTYFL